MSKKKSSPRKAKAEAAAGLGRGEEAERKRPWRYPWEPKEHDSQVIKWN